MSCDNNRGEKRELRSRKKNIVPQKYSFLSKGSKVEVCSEEDGYQNAWFPATVLEPPRKKEALVRYDHMLSEETKDFLVERVKVSFIRPTPPEDHEAIEPYDVVDAFHDEVWWTGYVVTVVNDRYVVAFKYPPDALELGRSHLRLHWDWVRKSKWVRPPKEVTTNSLFTPAMEIEVDHNEDKPGSTWLPAVYLGEFGFGLHMVKYKNSENEGKGGFRNLRVHLNRIRPCPPKIDDYIFKVYEKVDALHGSIWTVGVITKFLVGKRYVVSFRHENKEVEFDYSKIRPHMDWTDEQWVSESKGLVFASGCRGTLAHACDKDKSVEIIDLHKRMTIRKEVQQMDNHAITAAEKNDIDNSVIDAADEGASAPIVESHVLGAANKGTSELFMENGVLEVAEKETSAPRHAREETQTLGMVEDPQETLILGVESSCQPPVESDNIEMRSKVTRDQELPELPIEDLQTEVAAGVVIREAILAIEDCTTKNLEASVPACSKLTDPQTRVSSVSTQVDNQTFSLHEDGTNSLKDVTQSDTATLPFARRSPIWKFLESTELFRRLPQNPHFKPLLKCNEDDREGYAIGHMVNYANLIDKISKLPENDSRENIDIIMEGLGEYEELGFDVKVVQDRLNQWLFSKVELKRLTEELKGVKSLIEERTNEKTRIDGEVDAIDNEIKKLSGKRAQLMEESTEHRSKIMKLSSEAATINAKLSRSRESSRNLVVVIHNTVSTGC